MSLLAASKMLVDVNPSALMLAIGRFARVKNRRARVPERIDAGDHPARRVKPSRPDGTERVGQSGLLSGIIVLVCSDIIERVDRCAQPLEAVVDAGVNGRNGVGHGVIRLAALYAE